jgi:hypothetical protein
MNDRYTSRKWEISDNGDRQVIYCGGQIICSISDKETAKQVVREHNSHPDLLEALEKCHKWYLKAPADIIDKAIGNDFPANSIMIAISKAKGE